MKKLLTIFTLLLVFTMSASAARCRAFTHKGTQCTRTAVVSGYCKQHHKIKQKEQRINGYDEKVKSNYDNSGKPEKATSEANRCQATTKKGTRCKLKVMAGSRFCPVHAK